MNYEVFLQEIRKALQEKCPAETVVRIDGALKNNTEKEMCVTILEKGEHCSPAIFMNQYYEEYKKGKSLGDVAEEILRYYQKHHRKYEFDFSFYMDFSKVKEQIVCKLINYEKNRSLLEQVPYRRFLDMAVVFYYRMDNQILGKGSILIQDRHLKIWNITSDEICELATVNTIRLLPYQLTDIVTMMEELTGIKADCDDMKRTPMYVLTNTEQYFGAVNIIYESIMEAIAEQIHGDFFVLPSSIHECMIVPAEDHMDPKELQIMVQEINQTQVEPEEILSNSVYIYNQRKGMLEIACSG